MGTKTTRLDLLKPGENDYYNQQTEQADNWQKVDDYAVYTDRDKNAIWGGLDGGGLIEDPSVTKVVGKRYIGADGKAYICLVPSNINNSTNYTPCNTVDNLSKLQNLNNLYGTFNTANEKTEGNIDLVNASYTDLVQNFSVPFAGVYLIIATQRVTSATHRAFVCSINKGAKIITSHEFHCAKLEDGSYEMEVTLSAVMSLTPNDKVAITRTESQAGRIQRHFVLIKIA